MNPLDQLRDIHNAPPPGWWPPAPGWWVLALLVLIALFFILRWAWRRWQRFSQRRRILAQFAQTLPRFDQHGDRRKLAMDLDILLRRLALLRFNQEQASLTGKAWLRLWGLDEQHPMARVLLTAPYQPQPDYDPAALYGWVIARVNTHA